MPCCGSDEVSPAKEPHDRDDLNPLEHRKCRDILWLLLFLVAIAGSIAVANKAVSEGDLDVLKFGISSRSTLCGHGVEADYPKLLFCFNGTQVIRGDTFKVCSKKCPQTTAELIESFNDKSSEFVAATGLAKSYWTDFDHLLLKTLCVAPTISVLNRCILDVSIVNTTELGFLYHSAQDPGGSSLAKGSQMFLNAYHDIATSWYIILVCGLVGGMVFSFIWLQFLRCLAGPIVWLTLLMFFVGLIAVDILLAGKAAYTGGIGVDAPTGDGDGNFDPPAVEKQYEKYYRVLFWIFIGITIAFVLIFLFMVHRIQLSIALIHEAADAIKTMPQIMLTPFLPVLILAGVFMYGIFIAALLASTGTIENGELHWDRSLRRLLIYHIFFCMWVFFFLAGLHSVMMAGAIASYYWTRDKHTLSSPVSKSTYRALRYHLGSIAFGSLLLNLVKFMRWYLMHMTKRLKRLAGKDNLIVRFVLCCMNCCMWCFEKFIKFLTKNAYIMIAVDGHSFCVAAGQSWGLIMSNILRMTALHMVTSYVLFMSKFFVGFMCAIATTAWIEKVLVFQTGTNPVTSPFAPSICAFILGYFVSYIFFEVIEFCIDTLMMCFCLDDKRNSESGNYYASIRLLKFMAKAPKMRHDDHPH
eukprot:c4700_g1_i1.p1 GENE.c4700_g1_i1~~c4700_g1_i1.p1  ORF type:complete len:659 (+),score=150.75 c4700_g1_i1:62-1978(+)